MGFNYTLISGDPYLKTVYLAASMVSMFLTWVTRICGVMPPSFTAIRMKRITVYSHFHVGFSNPLATCLTQTVSWDKGKLVVDLRVGWLTSEYHLRRAKGPVLSIVT